MGKMKLSEMFIKYKDYKFFSVETEVKIKKKDWKLLEISLCDTIIR